MSNHNSITYFNNEYNVEQYMTNCFIKKRLGDEHSPIGAVNDRFLVRMDKYAVIPLEEYEELLSIAGRNINE